MNRSEDDEMVGGRGILSRSGCRIAGVFLLLSAAARAAGAAEPRPIFDGRSLAGWSGSTGRWRVEEGTIVGEIADDEKLSHDECLWWDGTVGDFDLALEYRLEGDPSAESGVRFRAARLPDGRARGYHAHLDEGTKWLGRISDEFGRGLLVERGVRLWVVEGHSYPTKRPEGTGLDRS